MLSTDLGSVHMVCVNNYKSLYEFNNDAILTLNNEGIILHINNAAKKLFNLDISCVVGSSFHRFIEKEYHGTLNEMVESVKQGAVIENVIRLAKDFQNDISYLSKFIPIEPNNLDKGLFLVLKEISMYDQLSEKYFDSEINFQIIAENVQDVIILLNDKKEYLYISPVSKEVYGYDPANYSKDDPPFFNIHPDDVEKLEENFENSIRYKVPFKMILRGLHLEKGWIWTEMSGTPIFDKDSKFSRMVLVARDISLQKEKEEHLYYLAYHDYLTGLPNRRFFYEKKDEAIEQLNKENIPFAVFMLDLDDFKLVNDQLGHEIGDKVIIEFGSRIVEVLGDEGIAARMGGDEFIILLNQFPTEEKVLQFIQRLQNRTTEPYIIDENTTIHLTTSIGVVICNKKYMDKFYYIKNADEALYNVKNKGKNKFLINTI